MRRTLIDFDLTTSDLSDNAFRVMVYLLLHADKNGECWPSLAKIAQETSRSERSLDFAIRELKSKNLLQSFNEGRGRYRFCVKLRTSATSCASKADKQAQKSTETSATDCAGKQETGAKSEVNKRKICTEQAQKVNEPIIYRELGIELGKELKPASSAREPFESDLPISLPTESPIVLLARKINDVAERWVKSHIQTGTDANDWRLKEVLREIIARGTNVKSAKYLQPMFDELPELKPEPLATTTTSPTEQPKRITSKDGKRVLIDGEWVDAAKPYENMPAPQAENKLGDAYDQYLFQLQGMKLSSSAISMAVKELSQLYDSARAGTVDTKIFHESAMSLIERLKGAVA